VEDKTNSMDETLKDQDINPDVSEDTLEKTEQESDVAAEDTDTAETVEESDAEDTEEDGKDGQKSGKSFFRKDKKEKKDKKDLKIDELNDRLIRNMAEFDNFRKRSENLRCLKSEQEISLRKYFLSSIISNAVWVPFLKKKEKVLLRKVLKRSISRCSQLFQMQA